MLTKKDINRIKNPKQLILLEDHFSKKKDTLSLKITEMLQERLISLNITTDQKNRVLKRIKRRERKSIS